MPQRRFQKATRCCQRRQHATATVVLLSLLSPLATNASASSSMRRRREEDNSGSLWFPVASRRTATVSAPAMMSLSERLDSLLGDDAECSDFRERLVAEEQQTLAEAQKPQTNNYLWQTASTALLLVLTTSLITSTPGGVMWKDLTLVFSSITSVMWLPLLWIRPRHFWQDFLSYLQVFGNRQTVLYIKDRVLPLTAVTLRKMILAEMWTRFWSRVFASVETHFRSSSDDDDNDKSRSFLVTSIRKGMRSLFKSSMQKHLQAGIVAAGAYFLNALRHVVFSGEAGDHCVE